MFEVLVPLHQMSSGKFPATNITSTRHPSSPPIMHFHVRFQTHLAGHTLTTGITSETNQ